MEYLRGNVHKTPVVTSQTTNERTGKNVYMKLENHQKTGAFKYRGASYKLSKLTPAQLAAGVVTASAGNHAQGVALAAKKLNATATIFMPEDTPSAKVEATKGYGATVRLVGQSFQEAFTASLEHKKMTGATYVHPFDDYDIMAGQGSIGVEMLEEIPQLDTIIVPIGGGGLISGIAVAAKMIKPSIKVIGVQAANAPSMFKSYYTKDDHVVLDSCSTIAEGIAVKQPGELTQQVVRQYVDEIYCVSESEIAYAMIYLLERTKSLVEGAGASALAALLAYNDKIDSQHTGVIVSGGNLDLSKMEQIQALSLKSNHKTITREQITVL